MIDKVTKYILRHHPWAKDLDTEQVVALEWCKLKDPDFGTLLSRARNELIYQRLNTHGIRIGDKTRKALELIRRAHGNTIPPIDELRGLIPGITERRRKELIAAQVALAPMGQLPDDPNPDEDLLDSSS